MRSLLVRTLALIAIASSTALGQQPAPATQGKGVAKPTAKATAKASAKAAARAAETPEVRATRDSMKVLSADAKTKKAARKTAKAEHDTAKVSRLTKEIAKDKADHKALKDKLPPRKVAKKP